MSNNDKHDLEQAKRHAEEAAKRLFGNRTKEENDALKNAKTVGSPKNLVTHDSDESLDESK